MSHGCSLWVSLIQRQRRVEGTVPLSPHTFSSPQWSVRGLYLHESKECHYTCILERDIFVFLAKHIGVSKFSNFSHCVFCLLCFYFLWENTSILYLRGWMSQFGKEHLSFVIFLGTSSGKIVCSLLVMWLRSSLEVCFTMRSLSIFPDGMQTSGKWDTLASSPLHPYFLVYSLLPKRWSENVSILLKMASSQGLQLLVWPAGTWDWETKNQAIFKVIMKTHPRRKMHWDKTSGHLRKTKVKT